MKKNKAFNTVRRLRCRLRCGRITSFREVFLKSSLAELLSCIPGQLSEEWPEGERYALAFSHGTMSVGLYAPVGADPQKPHARDEVYIIRTGIGELFIDGVRNAFQPGNVFFVGSGIEHRFENFSPDFSTWVVFWGPPGGESDRSAT